MPAFLLPIDSSHIIFIIAVITTWRYSHAYVFIYKKGGVWNLIAAG